MSSITTVVEMTAVIKVVAQITIKRVTPNCLYVTYPDGTAETHNLLVGDTLSVVLKGELAVPSTSN